MQFFSQSLLSEKIKSGRKAAKGICMANVLRIESKKYREESMVVSARIPKDMLQDIDFVAKESGRTRNEIITMFLDFALKNTEIIENQDN